MIIKKNLLYRSFRCITNSDSLSSISSIFQPIIFVLKKIESCVVKGLAMFAKGSMGYNIIRNYVLESLMKAHCLMLSIINTFTFWIFKK